MRMWMIDPKFFCRKHLCGEHCEIHMLVGCFLHSKNVRPWIDRGFIQLAGIRQRHDELADEMTARGYNHNTALPPFNIYRAMIDGCYDSKHKGMRCNVGANRLDLAARCPECAARMKGENNETVS